MMDAIKVISLRRSAVRRAEFERLNSHLKFEFVDAVDGRELSHDLIQASNLFDAGLPYTAGAYGCALSHLRLWERAIELDTVITVAEDDAIFRLDFEEQCARVLRELPSGWDIVLWGWNFDSILSLNVMPDISPSVMVFNQSQLRASIPRFQCLTEKPNIMRLHKCFGLPAYSISPVGARKFKSLCFPLRNFRISFPLLNNELMNNGIDIAMNNIYQMTHSNVCFPPLVITKNDHSISTIQNGETPPR